MIWNIYLKTFCKRIFLLVVVQLFFNSFFLSAQDQYTILEGNSNMKVLAGTKVSIAGNMLLLGDSTSIDNRGDLKITGDWINDANSPGFINQSPGVLRLAGDTQSITGAFPTDFYNLALEGTGLKILDNNANIIDSLYLNDRQLSAIGYTITMLNTDTGAVSRSTGYVSTDSSGSLAWQMLGLGHYVFPLGSDHVNKYRPVGIQNTAPDTLITMSVGMVDNDPSLNSYDRSLTDTSLCTLNSGYYDLINVISGNSPVNLTFFYDSADGNFNRTAYWLVNNNTNGEWSSTGNFTHSTSGNFQTLKTSAWSNFNLPAFALGYRGAPIQPFLTASGPLTFCPGGNVTLTVFGSYQAYQWSNGLTTQSILVDSSSTYYVTVTGAGDCKGVTSDVVTVNVVQPTLSPSGPLDICDTGTVTISVVGSYDGYSWSNGSNSSSITVNAANNTYTVTVTGAGGCTGVTSDVVTVHSCNTGIGDITSANAIKVYPNPTTGLVNINTEGLENIKTQYSLYDVLGEKVKDMVSSGGGNVTMYLNDLASGMYVLKVSADGRSYEQKIILTR